MTEGPVERPVIWGQLGEPVSVRPTARASSTVRLPGRRAQGRRLTERFDALDDAFSEQVRLTTSLGASEPQLVVVFEAIDEAQDLTNVAQRAGLEVLSEVEREYEPDPNFPRRTQDQLRSVGGTLHAVCVNERAKANILSQWRKWQEAGNVDWGYTPLRVLFEHLKDVRPWGPADRVRLDDVAASLEGLLPGDHPVELELWFRASPKARQQAQAEVADLIVRGGGRVISAAEIEQVGYHGMKCMVPLETLRSLADGDYDAVAAVKSSAVMYLRVTAQTHLISPPTSAASRNQYPLPSGDPVVCLLDGVPAQNHPLLVDRVIVLDPDDLASETAADGGLRRHGTAMASVAVWGDLSSADAPASRPVAVRPILAPPSDTSGNDEELPENELAPDLMRRVFRELFGDESHEGDLPSVVVVNISVGDPAAKFDGIVSSWARALDWLSAKYGVVVIVSAGNHPRVQLPAPVRSLTELAGSDRAKAMVNAVAEANPRRSLLAPADAINAVTVGAINADAAGDVLAGGYGFDPADGELIVQPHSALGPGHRRSVKPDLVAPGGRSYFEMPMVSSETLLRPSRQRLRGPGIRVAAPTGGEAFVVGTSPAAAEVARAAGRAVDAVVNLADRELTRSELAVATKAMVAHSAQIPADMIVHDVLEYQSRGYGALGRSMADGCDANEAAVLYVGDIGENERRTVYFPLPDGLQQRGLKRITATLAWLSPVNWRHRQYRRAALEFAKPTGFTNLPSAQGAPGDTPKRGTLQHLVWEVERTVGVGQGSNLELSVKCKGQAGGLRGDRVNFAVVLSLWVAPELGVDVYSQVRSQVVTRVNVQAARS